MGPLRASVVVAAYNAEPWIAEALESALAQTVGDLELVVVDDASTDATADVVRAVDDPRLRLVRAERNAGQAATWNRAVSFARAPYVKFLCADDRLREDCVERMLAVAETSPRVGLVFSRRTIDVAPGDAAGAAWREEYEHAHTRFGALDPVNHGRALFDRLARAGFPDNWIGEPTNVMMRRDAFRRLGGFHPEIRQPVDLDLWARALFHYDVGFVDAELSTYRVVHGSVTRTTAGDGSRWLDRLWLYESLLADHAIRAAYPSLSRLARGERLHALGRLGRATVRGGARPRIGEGRRYLRYKLRPPGRDGHPSGAARTARSAA